MILSSLERWREKIGRSPLFHIRPGFMMSVAGATADHNVLLQRWEETKLLAFLWHHPARCKWSMKEKIPALSAQRQKTDILLAPLLLRDVLCCNINLTQSKKSSPSFTDVETRNIFYVLLDSLGSLFFHWSGKWLQYSRVDSNSDRINLKLRWWLLCWRTQCRKECIPVIKGTPI